MILRRQPSNVTDKVWEGYTHTLHYSFLSRVVWMVIALTALMAVTICTYQGTENLIGWINQWSI